LAHLIANAVYKLLTGEDGVFDTQIIFAAQSGDPRRKSSRIAVIDQDGANGRFLTAPGEYCFLPKASPISPTIGYAFFNQRRALLRLHNLDNGKKTVLPITGIGASIEFSPQSPNILFSDANEGSTTLKLHDVQTGATRSLNRGYGGIAVSPSYSPDGTTFVVSSDQDLTDTRTVQKRRIGAPKLYVIQQNTGFATLISKGKGSYLSPAWSPDGQNIAFVKRSKGNYYIGVMDINGGNERMLACDHVIDSPSWAPNGRMVIFAAQQRRFGSFHLYIVDLTGRSLRKLPIVCNGTPQGGNHPSWRKYKSAAYKKLQAY
jgi:TolB protein